MPRWRRSDDSSSGRTRPHQAAQPASIGGQSARNRHRLASAPLDPHRRPAEGAPMATRRARKAASEPEETRRAGASGERAVEPAAAVDASALTGPLPAPGGSTPLAARQAMRARILAMQATHGNQFVQQQLSGERPTSRPARPREAPASPTIARMFASTQMMGLDLAFPDVHLLPTGAWVPVPHPGIGAARRA